jgi:hypothetical protein
MRVGEAQHLNHRETTELAYSCDCCGKPLGTTSGDRVGQMLAQLARFGLIGENLLARRRA